MVSTQGVVIFVTVLVAEVVVSQGFWYYSSSSSANTPKKMPPGPPPPHMQGYNLRSEGYAPWGNPQNYQSDNTGHLTVALPVAVPYQPQMGPPPPTLQGTLHNVQLVPCLCPVSTSMVNKDYESMLSQQHQQQQPQLQPSPSYSQIQTSSANNSP